MAREWAHTWDIDVTCTHTLVLNLFWSNSRLGFLYVDGAHAGSAISIRTITVTTDIAVLVSLVLAA